MELHRVVGEVALRSCRVELQQLSLILAWFRVRVRVCGQGKEACMRVKVEW